MNVNVITGKSFLKIEKRQRSKILILVCQQTIETFDNIARKMKLNGIKNNQIINVRY